MKVILLAGGMGTRISEESDIKPKPMIEIGGKPMLWHIMKIYSHYGFHDFIICLGYKGYVIKEYFSNYFLHQSDVTFDLADNKMEVHGNYCEPWKVTLVDTGAMTMTGGRIKRIQNYVGKEPFLLTYGDGVADIDLSALVAFHRKQGKILTMTAIQPEGRFGMLDIQDNSQVSRFIEKPEGDGAWINGGFMVCEPELFDEIPLGDDIYFEREPLENLAKKKQLMAYKHHGFWKCMDTLRDKQSLDQLWQKNQAPWKIWQS